MVAALGGGKAALDLAKPLSELHRGGLVPDWARLGPTQENDFADFWTRQPGQAQHSPGLGQLRPRPAQAQPRPAQAQPMPAQAHPGLGARNLKKRAQKGPLF